MDRIFIFLIFAVLSCQAQYENYSSSDLKQENGVFRVFNRNEPTNRRPIRKREMESESLYRNCFVSKGCFGYPSECISRRDCEIFISFTNNDNEITFQMKGRLESENYMAMGISFDDQMGDDAVTECFRRESAVIVRESWNDGKSNKNTRQLPKDAYEGEFKDGLTTCTWTEGFNKVTNRKTFQFAEDTYYLLLAKGPMRSERIRRHTGKIASQEPLNFTAFGSITDQKSEMDPESMYHNCFVSNGCFGYPSGCISRNDCEVFLSFTSNENGISFQMKGILNSQNYIAMGLSFDDKMGDDAVTECFQNGSRVIVRESWNDRKSNINTKELPEDDYTGEFKDGWITCTWTENYTKVSNGKRFQLAQENYYLLLATGMIQGERIGYHFAKKIASQEPVNFTAFDANSDKRVSDDIKIDDSTTEAMLVTNKDESIMGRKPNKNESSVGTNLVFSYTMIALTFATLKVLWLPKL